MAEPAKPTDQGKPDPAKPAAPAEPSGKGAEPEKPATGAFDPSKLSDEDLKKVFEDSRLYQHPRFKSLSERAKKADEYEKEQDEIEKKRLAEQGKYKELADKAKAEAEAAKNQVADLTLKNSIQAEAVKLGIVDPEAAALLVDRSKIKVENGTAEGVKEALESLVESKPYLKGTAPQAPVGSPSNPSPGATEGGTKKFKASQLQDPVFWKENEKDILAAINAGLVEDDINLGPALPSTLQGDPSAATKT